MFELDLTKINEKPKLYICKPNKEIVGILSSYFNLVYNPKISQINQLDFSILTDIEIDHQLTPNPSYNLLKYKYLIKYDFMDQTEYFVINTVEDSSDESTFTKNVNCYSLAYNLTDEIITYSNIDTDYSKNATEITSIVLENTIWKIGTISASLDLKYLQFSFSSKTALDCLYEIATAFSALLYFDTINYTVSLSDDLTSIENIERIANSTNYGLVFDYGKYINNLSFKPNPDSFCTHLKVLGKNDLTLNSVTITGGAELVNYQYFMFPFSRDQDGNILEHSDYMSDELCIAIEDYQEKIFTYEGQFETLITNKISLQESLNTKYTDLSTLNTQLLIILDSLDIAQTNNQDTSQLIIQRNAKQLEIDNKKLEINNCQFNIIVNNDAVNTGNIIISIDGNDIIFNVNSGDIKNTIANTINDLITSTYYNNNNKYPLVSSMKSISINNNVLTVSYFSTKDYEDIIFSYTDESNTGINITFDSKSNVGLENQISNINNQMVVINNELAEKNNFTESQLFELKASYVKKKIIRNDYISDPKILLEFAQNEFKKYYSIPISLELDIVNMFNCLDVGCQLDRQKVKIGEIVRIIYKPFSIDVKCIITELTYDHDQDFINLTISNIADISKDVDKYLELLNQSISASAELANSKSDWNTINSTNNSVASIIETLQGKYTGELNLAGNEYCSLDRKGLTATDPNDNKRIVRVTHGAVGLSKSGGDSFETCISADGIVSEKLIGKILLGNSLTLDASDAEGNKIMTVNTEGVTILNLILSLLRSDNKTRILMDVTSGIKIQKNTGTVDTPVWIDVFYTDNEGNLVSTGYLQIGSGNSIFIANDTGIKLGGTDENAPFRVDLSGNAYMSKLTATNADVSGDIDCDTLRINGTDILDELNQKINGSYLSDGTVTNEKVNNLNAEKIITGTLSGVTIDVSTNATVGNNISVGQSVILRADSVSGGIKWGTDILAPAIYRDPQTGGIYAYNPSLGEFRLDQVQVARLG